MSKIKNLLKEKFKTLYFFYQYIGNKLFAVFGFSVLMVFMDGFGLAMFIPLLQIADQGNAPLSIESNDKIASIVYEIFALVHAEVNIVNMLFLIIGIFILKGIFFYYANKYNAIAMQTVSLKMRGHLASSLEKLSYNKYVSTDVGRLQNSLLAEVWQVINGSMQYMDAIKNILFIAIYLGFAFFMDWKFSVLVMVGGGLTNWIYKYFYKRTQELSRDITKNNHRYGGVLVEVINHFKYVKATGRHTKFFGMLQNHLVELVNNNISVATINAKLSAIREPMTIGVICVVILLHVAVFKSPLSGVIVILLFFYRVMQKVVDVQTNWNNYLSQIGAIENIIDFQKYLDQNAERFYIGKQPYVNFNNISLRNISVKYGEQEVLKNITLNLYKNQSIAFVGESGSGKTTLVNVISTLIPFESGNYYLNGQDILDVDNTQFKSNIGYISQEPTIFNASIFENITFWDEPTTTNIIKFNKVIDMCALRGFLERLPSGYDTLLGNNGLNISGGQKQRISIARELYRDVDILIMDEATAALDSETENEIKESLESLQGQVTIISIAHRLSTVRNADCLYLLDKGEIIASGNFEELKQKSEYFGRLTALQGI